MSSSEIQTQISESLDSLYQLDGDLAENWEEYLYDLNSNGKWIPENWNEDTLHDILLDLKSATPHHYYYTETTPND